MRTHEEIRASRLTLTLWADFRTKAYSGNSGVEIRNRVRQKQKPGWERTRELFIKIVLGIRTENKNGYKNDSHV